MTHRPSNWTSPKYLWTRWASPRRASLIAVVLLLFALALAAPAHAQEPWAGTQPSAKAEFGAGITFALQAQTASPVQALYLFYQLEGERARNRVNLEDTGTRINAEWTWELEPGSIPPGRAITYWWRAELADGRTLETERATVTYEDTRFTWKQRQEGNLILYWYGDSQREADKIMAAAQSALQRLQAGTGVELQKPIRIFLYRSKSDMRLAIPSRSEGYDIATITLGMAMGGDTIVILSTAADADRTIAHELSHIVIGAFTENPLGGLPTWLDEGLAMYAEGDLRGENQADLDRAIRTNTLISVRSLSAYTGDPSQVDLFYGECYSVVEFLIDTYGADKMDALLKTFKRGMYQEDALREVYGFGIDELDARWREAIGAPPQPTPAPTTPPVLPTPRPQEEPSSTPICSSAALILAALGVVIWRRVAA
ncbi:MAG: hypothetical protein Kow00123_26210 [Anaerolineales bacterium]